MGKDESLQTNRRFTRSSSCTSPISKATNHLKPLSINDIASGGESISLDELIGSFPGRRYQILELIKLLGPLNSPMFPLFVYGAASTGKTSIILQIFKHLKRPFTYCSSISCYNPRIMFESILNQLSLHRRDGSSGYMSVKKCEKPSDFVNLLREALNNLIESLKGDIERSCSKKSHTKVNGRMVYLIFDNIELVREWDKSFSIIPLLFNLYGILKMPEVGIIFVSRTSLDTFPSETGYVEPFPVYFPDYAEDDLRHIFMKKQPNPKLYSSFLEYVLQFIYQALWCGLLLSYWSKRITSFSSLLFC